VSKQSGGRLELVCGPMFAGKSTRLIALLQRAQRENKTICAVKPARDTRYHRDRLMTHAGTSIAATTVNDSAELPTAVGAAEVIGIDEVHFFDPSIADVCRKLTRQGRHVIVCGVDLDQNGQPFATVAVLEAMADTVTRLTATCACCGKTARYTQRMIDDDAAIVVGGPEAYQPRCDRCFQRPAS